MLLCLLALFARGTVKVHDQERIQWAAPVWHIAYPRSSPTRLLPLCRNKNRERSQPSSQHARRLQKRRLDACKSRPRHHDPLSKKKLMLVHARPTDATGPVDRPTGLLHPSVHSHYSFFISNVAHSHPRDNTPTRSTFCLCIATRRMDSAQLFLDAEPLVLALVRVHVGLLLLLQLGEPIELLAHVRRGSHLALHLARLSVHLLGRRSVAYVGHRRRRRSLA
jgi:hypothetical protein